MTVCYIVFVIASPTESFIDIKDCWVGRSNLYWIESM